MKWKISSLGIELAEKRNILKDVFGSVEDGEKGLVDSGNSVEFDERLQVLKAVWNPEF